MILSVIATVPGTGSEAQFRVQARTIPEAFALIPMRAAELGFALTNDGSGVVYTVRVVA